MPESGVPPQLISEEEEASDYAFVGDITEVTTTVIPFFHVPY